MRSGPHGPSPLRVEVERVGPATVLIPRGELDIASSHRLVTAALGLVRESGPITLELSGITFVDVSGVRAVLHVAGLLGERLKLTPAPPAIQRVFALTGAERQLPFTTPGNVSAFPGAAERNLRFARRVWQTYAEDGLEAMLELLPETVEWRLLSPPGAVASGSSELRRWHGEERRSAQAVGFRAVGDAVLVQVRLLEASGTREVFSLLEFEGGMLVRGTSFAHEQDALAHATG